MPVGDERTREGEVLLPAGDCQQPRGGEAFPPEAGAGMGPDEPVVPLRLSDAVDHALPGSTAQLRRILVQHADDDGAAGAAYDTDQPLTRKPVFEHVHQDAGEPFRLVPAPPLPPAVDRPVDDEHQEDRHEEGQLACGDEGEEGGAHGARSARSRSTLATRIGMLSGLTR
ncbi:MAG: hypothetical protein AMS20_03095 [Gemmatimonas sp. SG8_28]|nr:MAG: hypothetical protein AMS20_03095 [Gemmatimonas sp. SG8_28]